MASTKIFTLFAGVNGAGKSTLFSVDTAADLGIRLNTDEIVKERGCKAHCDGLELVASYVDGTWIRSGVSCLWAEELISGL